MKRYSDSVADNTLLVSQNVTNLMNDIRAEDLLNDAVYYIDARDASASGQTIDNLGTAKELLPTTLGSSTSADSNDPKFLDHTGTNYVYLPGTGTNSLQVADSAALDITGDIDLRWYGTVDTLSVANPLIHKRDTTNNRSFVFNYASTNVLQFAWSTDGTVGTQIVANSTVSPTFATGTPIWFRVTLSVASNYEVKFYTSTNGTTWTQLGTTITGVGATSIFAGTSPVYIGWDNVNAANAVGRIFRAQIYNGIDGTKVLDVDTSVITAGSATSFTAVTGQTVTINRSTSGRKTVAVTQPTWLFGTDDYMEVNNRYMASGTYLYLPGVAGNYASTPDAAALDITGDIDLRVKVALDDWTPSAETSLIDKTASASTRAYGLRIATTGVVALYWSTDGTAISSAFSTAVTGLTDGATKWVRATLDVDNGASGNTATFYLSDDGTTWTQLGNTVVQAGVTSIFSSSSILEIGSIFGGTSRNARGKFFRAQVLNGIDGTVAFDANFETSITSLLQTSFTESSTNAATVTINRNGSTFRSAGITEAGYLYPGATNTFSASATDFLNFGASDSFTVLAVARRWDTQGAQTLIYKKVNDTAPNPGYGMLATTTDRIVGYASDGTNQASPINSTYTSGPLYTTQLIRNVSTDTVATGTQVGTTSTTDTTTATLSNIQPLRVGVTGGGGAYYADMEFIAGAVFRRPLTSAEITLITNYFNRRSL